MSSQRAATLQLSPSTDHQTNYYDVLHDEDPASIELRLSYDRPTTVCPDDGYLTPAQVNSDTWTTATMHNYYKTPNDAGCHGLCDSRKYLQLQESAYYEYI